MSARAVSPTTALLLRCGPSEGLLSRSAEIHRLAGEIDNWQHFLELAARHAVVPLADRTLALTAADAVPSEIALQLRAAAQRGAVSSLRLSGELVLIMRDLAKAGVEAMPFKGPTLAALVYGNLSLRQYQDLDILVHRADVERARVALFGQGYVPVIAYDENQRATIQLSGHHEQLVRDDVTVELHWSLNNRTLTHDAFEQRWWEDRQQVTIGGVAMHTLGPERLILYLCMHGGKHSWARLGWLFDLDFALHAYPDADWSLVRHLARENGAERMLDIGLHLLRKLLVEERLVAPPLQARRESRHVNEVVDLICNRMRSDELYDPYLDYRLQIQSRERLRDQFRYTLHIVAAPHPADVSFIGLPRALHRVYYIIRPIRLLWKRLVRHVRPARTT